MNGPGPIRIRTGCLEGTPNSVERIFSVPSPAGDSYLIVGLDQALPSKTSLLKVGMGCTHARGVVTDHPPNPVLNYCNRGIIKSATGVLTNLQKQKNLPSFLVQQGYCFSATQTTTLGYVKLWNRHFTGGMA